MTNAIIPAEADEKVAAMAIAWEIVNRTVANDPAASNEEKLDRLTMAFIQVFEDIYETIADEFEFDIDDEPELFDLEIVEDEEDEEEEEEEEETEEEPATENGKAKKKNKKK